MKRRSILLALVIYLVSSSAAGFAYDTMELEKDFKKIIELGNRVYKSSIKASRVLSETLVEDGEPTSSISAGQVSIVQQQLTTEDKDKVELLVSEMQLDKFGEYMPKPNNFNTEALEKLISQKRKTPGKVPVSSPQPQQKIKRNDKNLIAKFFPDEKLINEILVSTHQTSANPANLDSDSVQFRDKCVDMFNQLVKRGEAAARIKFYELLNKKENKSSRWYFAGVASMVAGFSEFEKEQSIQKLKELIPVLQNESKVAAKAIDWDFAVAIESMPKAKASFQKSLDAKWSSWQTGTVTNITTGGNPKPMSELFQINRSSNKRGWWSNSNNDNKGEKSKLSTNYWSECWNHMWGDMGDQLQSNFDKGTQYGQKCGEFIGMASGIRDTFGKMAAEKTSYNIVQQIRDYAYDTAIGEMGLKPDPYSIVGHFAGGAIGTLGGAIGNAAGWVVGTVESIAAQRGGKKAASTKKRGAGDQTADEMITLF